MVLHRCGCRRTGDVNGDRNGSAEMCRRAMVVVEEESESVAAEVTVEERKPVRKGYSSQSSQPKSQTKSDTKAGAGVGMRHTTARPRNFV